MSPKTIVFQRIRDMRVPKTLVKPTCFETPIPANYCFFDVSSSTSSDFLSKIDISNCVLEGRLWPLAASRAAESRGESAESPRRVWGETAGHHWPKLGFFVITFLSLWESFGVQKTRFKRVFCDQFRPGFKANWQSLGSLLGSLCCTFRGPFGSKYRFDNSLIWSESFRTVPCIEKELVRVLG